MATICYLFVKVIKYFSHVRSYAGYATQCTWHWMIFTTGKYLLHFKVESDMISVPPFEKHFVHIHPPAPPISSRLPSLFRTATVPGGAVCAKTN